MEAYHRATLTQLHEALRSGETTATELVYQAMERIAALDSQGPCLNAVLEINPQARALAAACDAQIAQGRILGPLHGIPVLLKDNIDTDDMMHTSAGSLALADRYAPRDAFVAHKLRQAGAIILGKVNMTEFANFMTEGGMPNGYSSRGGQVKNPWGDYDPSGSSTGSAVAVAAGYVPVSVGTETAGSIISPAGELGVVGVKPTVGLISRSGIIPISVSQDTAGPMGRCVLDCAIMLDAMAGADPMDPYSLHGKPTTGFADAVRLSPLRLDGLTLGLYNKGENGDAVSHDAFLHALEALRSLGAKIVEVELPKSNWKDMTAVLTNEFRACMDASLKGSAGISTMAQIASYNLHHAQECLRYGQTLIDQALRPDTGMKNPAYVQARRNIHDQFTRGVERLFGEHQLSAIIAPQCHFFPASGFPSVTLPIGLHEGHPAQLVLNGCGFSEHTLLMIAAALERVIGVGVAPELP